MFDKKRLQEALTQGAAFELLFFWGHRATSDVGVTRACLSQWFTAPFEVAGVSYATAEHFVTASKAELFGDLATRDAIQRASDPAQANALGRQVKGFDEALWIARRWDIVVAGNAAKFSQNPRLGAFLLATGDRVLVEASPVDRTGGSAWPRTHPRRGTRCTGRA